jgi:hypothetical protein
MVKKNIIRLGIVAVSFSPMLAFAQTGLFITIRNITTAIDGIVSALLPIVFALAILAFFWGIFLYVFSTGEEKKVEGKHIMLWAVIAIAIMASLFGIIQVLQVTFLGGTSGGGSFQTPDIFGQ